MVVFHGLHNNPFLEGRCSNDLKLQVVAKCGYNGANPPRINLVLVVNVGSREDVSTCADQPPAKTMKEREIGQKS